MVSPVFLFFIETRGYLYMRMIREGSSKQIFEVDQTSIALRCTRHTSIFDVGRVPFEIPGKDLAVCASGVQSFEIARGIRIPTHFIEQLDPVTVRVRKANVVRDRTLQTTEEGYVIPLEWIYRFRVSGSLLRRFLSGKLRPETYGLPAGITPAEGTPLPYVVNELTTKFEHIDRPISEEEARILAGLTKQDVEEIWTLTNIVARAVRSAYMGAGFDICDGKMEWLMLRGRKKVLGDFFGTPDEDRPVLIIRPGVVQHYGKEFGRDKYIKNGYHKKLQEARRLKEPDPPIPQLDQSDIHEWSMRYKIVAEAYAGKRINF